MTPILKITAICGLAAAANAQSFNWVLESPATLPTARERTATGTDGSSYYMYGGQQGSNVNGFDELWSYDGTDWTLLTASGASGPGTRRGAVGAYDIARGKFVVFSGQDTNNTPGERANDTWEWDSTNGWVNVTPAAGNPDGRWLVNNGVYVPGFGIMFHGGNARDAGGVTYRSNETWWWNGGQWTMLSNSGPTVQNAMMVYRPNENDLLLHGGQFGATGTMDGETWSFDLTTFGWTQLTTGGTTPFNSLNSSQGLFAAMTYYNPLSGNVIVHGGNGGNSSNTTWQFDGADWSEISTNGTGCRNGGMHWINALGKAVYGPCNETNGARNRTRSHGPSSAATATSYGSGCNGQAGTPLTLTADNDPWAGVTFSATCSGMSAASPLKLSVWGVATASTPITGLLGAGAGCTLLNSAEAIDAAVSASTTHNVTFAIPADPALAGFLLHLQVAELSPALTDLATSNGLTLTVGS